MASRGWLPAFALCAVAPTGPSASVPLVQAQRHCCPGKGQGTWGALCLVHGLLCCRTPGARPFARGSGATGGRTTWSTGECPRAGMSAGARPPARFLQARGQNVLLLREHWVGAKAPLTWWGQARLALKLVPPPWRPTSKQCTQLLRVLRARPPPPPQAGIPPAPKRRWPSEAAGMWDPSKRGHPMRRGHNHKMRPQG